MPAGVQPMPSLYSKRNVERHRSINFIELIQVEGDTPIQTMLAVGSTPRQSFNKRPSLSTSRGCVGDDVSGADCWQNFRRYILMKKSA